MSRQEILSPTATLDSPLLSPLARSEVDLQVATAKAYPRSHEKAIKNIMSLATLNEAVAKTMIYALPRDGKPIKGPSIRFAEIVFSQWGNCRVNAAPLEIDRANKIVKAEGIYHDLESNAAWRRVADRPIVDSMGRIYRPDMIVVTSNAAAAIAARNAILAGVPRAVWGEAYLRCERVLAGSIKTLAVAREEAMRDFHAFGVTPERVCAALSVHGLADISIDHIILMRGMHAALVSGEETVETMFPALEPKDGVRHAQPAKEAAKAGTEPDTAAPSEAAKPAAPRASDEEGKADNQPVKEAPRRQMPRPPGQ